MEPPKRAHIPDWVAAGFRMLSQQFFPLLIIVWVNGVVLRMSVRDSVDFFAPLYYATPWPVLAILTLAFLRYFWRQPGAVFAILFTANILGGAWIMESWRTTSPSKEPADVRVLQWNVARPWKWQSNIMASIRKFDADIVAVSEPVPDSNRGKAVARTIASVEAWRTAFPDYACELQGKDMLFLVRGEILDRRSGALYGGSGYTLYDVRTKAHLLRVLQIDIDARPIHPRRPALAALAELVQTLGDQPLIVIGDFNTPRESVHLEPLKRNLQHAWLSAGTGCGETWPSFFPMLSLDQIWCGYGLRAVRCQHGVTFRSDHRPEVADLKFE